MALEQDAPARAQRRVLAAAAAAGLVVLLLIGYGVWAVALRTPAVRFGALFSASVGIYPGSDVKMLGVTVGTVDSVTPQGKLVLVRMHLDRGRAAAADTGAVILSPSLVSDRYVQLTGLYTGGAKLADGSTIPQARTATPVELDQLYDSVNKLAAALGPNGANSTGALARLIETGAANLDGNGKALNDTLQQLSKATSIFAGAKDDLFDTIDNLKKFTTMLAGNDAGVQQVNSQLAEVSQVLAADRQSFAAALNQLGTALDTVSRFIRDNRARLKSNVDKLAVTSQLLTKQRQSLEQVLTDAPVAVQNLLNAYDPAHNTLNGRADLNELDGLSGTAAPPLLLPSAGGSASATASPGVSAP
ncbi:MAG TPA: MCE family protein [Jatrophihabitans sp.]|nr:MCE family protein [Jatrophihabitans sp.]